MALQTISSTGEVVLGALRHTGAVEQIHVSVAGSAVFGLAFAGLAVGVAVDALSEAGESPTGDTGGAAVLVVAVAHQALAIAELAKPIEQKRAFEAGLAVRIKPSEAKFARRVALYTKIVVAFHCSLFSEIAERANPHALVVQVEVSALTQDALVTVGPGTSVAAVVAILARYGGVHFVEVLRAISEAGVVIRVEVQRQRARQAVVLCRSVAHSAAGMATGARPSVAVLPCSTGHTRVGSFVVVGVRDIARQTVCRGRPGTRQTGGVAVRTLLPCKVAEFVGIAIYALPRRRLQKSHDGLALRAVQISCAVAFDTRKVALLAGLRVLVSERPRCARQTLHRGHFQVLHDGSARQTGRFPGSVARCARLVAVRTDLISVVAVLVGVALNALQGRRLVVGVVATRQTIR